MHHIYTTPAFVVHSTPYGEAGKFILLFTRDFGMIGAVAQGIRLTQSKLRHHIQDFNFSTVSVVRGKEVWRITGALEIEKDITAHTVHVKILNLLKRLLQGEEKNEKLFEILEVLYREKIEEADYDAVECLIVLRILNTLGYITVTDTTRKFLESTDIGKGIVDEMRGVKKEIIKVINSALTESHL